MKPPSLERQVLDTLPITIYAVDLDGRFTFLNRSSGRSAQANGAPQLCDDRAVLGSSIWDALTDVTMRAPMEQAMATLREARATSLSWEIPGSSPTEERIFVMQVSALVERQVVRGYVFSTVDITPNHHSHAVKRRFDAIGEVSAGVARELRNPLFGISSAAQLLRFRVKDDPVIEKSVGRILREVERLNSLVTALLEYGRPNTIRLVPGDPDAVWDEVLEQQRGRLESRAQLLHRARAEPPVHCAIDAEQLTHLFINLLANATDAAPQGTDLTLESSALPNGAWRCRLHNGGAAIPADVLPRVFEVFFSTKPGSTGIGLALCQRIVEEHGGTIALESAPGRGTTVSIILPAHAPHGVLADLRVPARARSRAQR
jgi:signal transduction histidine kinase